MLTTASLVTIDTARCGRIPAPSPALDAVVAETAGVPVTLSEPAWDILRRDTLENEPGCIDLATNFRALLTMAGVADPDGCVRVVIGNGLRWSGFVRAVMAGGSWHIDVVRDTAVDSGRQRAERREH